MPKTKHTPGPWLTAAHGTGRLVYSDHGRGPEGATSYVAQAIGNDADARLIAAAPDLLEAAAAALAALSQPATLPADIAAAKEWLRAAIAKARGEA